MMIQDGLYSRFAKHVETFDLEEHRVGFKVAPRDRGKTDQILHSPTRIMLCEAVDQRLNDPIT